MRKVLSLLCGFMLTFCFISAEAQTTTAKTKFKTIEVKVPKRAKNQQDVINLTAHNFLPEEAKKALMEKYKPQILKDLEQQAKQVGGHGGMDFIMDYRLVYCLHNGLPLDMDVYDLAEWCCLAPLSKLSLENGSAPVAIPDFTRGAWQKQKGYIMRKLGN